MKKNKSFINSIPAWGLSLILAFMSMILIFALVSVFDLLGLSKYFDIDFTSYVCTGIVIAFSCFIICKTYPKSFWYVPFICNMFGILSASIEPAFWSTDMWIAFVIGWVLSILGTFAGVLMNKRST